MSAPTATESPAGPVAASAPAAAAPAAAEPTVEDGFRVYIGNLAFSATEAEIREHLATVGGEITSVILPTRHKNRPAGYAFVSYKNEADATKAVETLNETEIGGRKVHLQLARSKEENAERRTALLEKRKEAKAAKAAKAKEAKEEKEAAEAASSRVDSDKSADKPKKKKAAKKQQSRRRRPEDDDETAVDEEPEAAPKTSKSKKAKDAKAKEETTEAAEPKERKPRLALTGEVSKNTVFVANLPFTVDDDALSAIFTDLSIKVQSAHVIKGLRRLPGRRPFRGSKGFGFVVLEDAAQQEAAVEKVNGMAIGERKITAKVAQEMKPIEEIEAEVAKADGVAKDEAADKPKAETEEVKA